MGKPIVIIYYAKFSHTPKLENPVVTPRNQIRFIGVRKPESFLLLFLLFLFWFLFVFVLFLQSSAYFTGRSYCLSMGRCLYTII